MLYQLASVRGLLGDALRYDHGVRVDAVSSTQVVVTVNRDVDVEEINKVIKEHQQLFGTISVSTQSAGDGRYLSHQPIEPKRGV